MCVCVTDPIFLKCRDASGVLVFLSLLPFTYQYQQIEDPVRRHVKNMDVGGLNRAWLSCDRCKAERFPGGGELWRFEGRVHVRLSGAAEEHRRGLLPLQGLPASASHWPEGHLQAWTCEWTVVCVGGGGWRGCHRPEGHLQAWTCEWTVVCVCVCGGGGGVEGLPPA